MSDDIPTCQVCGKEVHPAGGGVYLVDDGWYCSACANDEEADRAEDAEDDGFDPDADDYTGVGPL